MTVEAMAEDGQVIDAEVDESEATDTLDSSERGSDESPAKFEAAPQCAGCHRRGVSLSLLENGKRYCDRCAQEVERLMGIGPLFPTAQTLPTHDAHEAHDGGAHDDHEHSDNHHYSHDDGHDGAGEAHDEPEYELEHEPDEHDQYDERDDDFGESETVDEAEIVAEAPDLDVGGLDGDDVEEPTAITAAATSAAVGEPVAANEPEPTIEAAHEGPETPAVEAAGVESQSSGSDGSAADAGDEARRSLQELASKIGQQNQEAAEAVHPLIPKPTTVSAEPLEEHALMERVEEQIRPPATEAAQPTQAAQPAASGGNELVAALAAERDRLLDQRRALEARFRADVEAIDDRLVHVESLLGSQGVAIAS